MVRFNIHNREELLQTARDRAIVQYFEPFVSIHISSLAAAFKMSEDELEPQLVRLIGSNKLQVLRSPGLLPSLAVYSSLSLAY